MEGDTFERKGLYRYVSLRACTANGQHLLPKKEFGILCLIAISIYLLQGIHAEILCSLLISVPAAILSYRILLHQGTSIIGYQSVLFYWSLHGGLTLIDPLFSHSYGYFFIKFLIMAAVFGHVARSNQNVFNQTIGIDRIQAGRNNGDESIFSPPMTMFSDGLNDSSSIYMDRLETALSFSRNPDDMMPTQREEDSDSTMLDIPLRCQFGVNRVLTPFPGQEVSPPVDSVCTVEHGFGHILTNPFDTLSFCDGNEWKTMTMHNITTDNIMWALKTNALHRLSASPSCGVIPVGGFETVKIHRKPDIMSTSTIGYPHIDKIAVDYSLVGDTEKFDRSFYSKDKSEKRRIMMRIEYKD